MLLDASPGVRDNCGNRLVKILFFYTAPVHEDTHALRLHPGHDVKLIPIERESHHWHTVIDCLKYAIHPAVADEGFHVGMACRQRNGSRSVPFMLKQGYRWLPQHTVLMYVQGKQGMLSREDATLWEHIWLSAAQSLLANIWKRREIGAKVQPQAGVRPGPCFVQIRLATSKRLRPT